MKSQNQEIYELLIERGLAGINSFEPLRNNRRQLPRIINDLEDPNKKWKMKGKIEHRREKNTSVTYVFHPMGVEMFKEKQQVKFIIDNGVYKAVYE